MESILIIRTSAFGDILQTLPVLEYLRYKFPHARIDWVVEKKMGDLVRPFVDFPLEMEGKKWLSHPFSSSTYKELKAFLFSLRKTSYDLIFDLQGNIKSGLIARIARGKKKVGFGWRSSRERLGMLGTSIHLDLPDTLPIREKYLQLVQTYFEDTVPFAYQGLCFPMSQEETLWVEKQAEGNGALQLMVALCSRWRNKELKHTSALQFLKKIEKETKGNVLFYFVFGDRKEQEKIEALASHFPGKARFVSALSFPLWQGLMKKMDGVLCVDSAALHLAAMAQVPIVSFFGPTRGEIFNPRQGLFLQGACPYDRKFVKQCPKLRTCPTGACMDQITEEQFSSAFQEAFQSRCEL